MVLKETVQPVEVPFTLVETGVGTYSSLELDLPVNVQQGLVFDLDVIELDMAPAFDPVAAGEVLQEVQFTLNVQTALLGFDDPNMIAAKIKRAHASAALVHSGVEFSELHMDTRGRANLIAKNEIFVGVDSVNTTVIFTATGRLVGSIVKIKADQLTQLVLSQIRT